MNNTLTVVMAAATAFVGGMWCHQWLKWHQRRDGAHTPAAPPAQGVPIPPSQVLPLPATPATAARAQRDEKAPQSTGTIQAPLTVRLLYRNSKGEEGWHQGVMLSRKPDDGGMRLVNLRVDGESFVKSFLIERMLQLDLLDHNKSIEGPEAIRAELLLRLRVGRRRRPTASPKAAAPTVRPANLPADPQASRPAGRLSHLLPEGAQGFAVFDLETTALSTQSARIVEIAIVQVDPDGAVIDSWESLINPGESISNAFVHGINDALVQTAPLFAELAPTIAARLHGLVPVAHNLKAYDLPILRRHFEELPSLEIDLGDGIDTMPSPRRKLQLLCADHGIGLADSDAHTALGDTQALAALLQKVPAHLKPAATAAWVQGELPQKSQEGGLPRSAAAASAVTPPSPGPKEDSQGWKHQSLELTPGLTFMATAPKSRASDTEIRRGEAHGERLGLTYRKQNSIPKRTPPAFLLTTSLTLSNRKMQEARERGLPVVLVADLLRCESGDCVRAHAWNQARSHGER